MDVSTSSDVAVDVTLSTAAKPDIDLEDRASLVCVAVAHLKLDKFQLDMIRHEQIDSSLVFLMQCCSARPLLTDVSDLVPDYAVIEGQNTEEENELAAMCKSLIQALSDVSAHDEFSIRHASLDTTTTKLLQSWLTVKVPQLQLCACIMLGNLARSDNLCRLMVAVKQLHAPVLRVLASASDTSLLHSAAGFLRNLALPVENKLILGEAGAIEITARFWTSSTTTQLAVVTTALARQLINNVFDNVARLLKSLSDDADSPAFAKTYLSLLLSMFDKFDEPAVKVEVARIVAAALRC